ncbi:ClpXP protease specificity-enhancing factor [Endozoicomonas sp. 8E]|uniref:ClpXP protease specificity-enhancing factor n=1 Tax=Endozoicomonas sp. 8E TaxID=3035692 RepID=UPI002938FD86|nr:ClpXP protease specificity-enhancing factor [Endozoicomonas sp. 8E]
MTMTSSRPYIARAIYDWILENDCTPYILVDTARKGVEVPREYVKDNQIVLNISPAAVRAMHMENDVITFDGRFGGEALTIVVPIDALMAIYARENGQGMVFEVEPIAESEEDVSPHFELEAVPVPESQEAPVEKEEQSDKTPRKPGRPNLKVVK